LEPALQEELDALGIQGLNRTEGGLSFVASLADVYRANLESRLASRVLMELVRVPYRSEIDVYKAAYDIMWPRLFTPDHTIKVKVSARRSPLPSLDFVTLRIKDGVCDRFVKESGRRPSVQTQQPDVRIDAFLDETHLSLYLDTSGEPLFKRGFRRSSVDAPLRENLAAGLLHLAGWTGDHPLIDPLCGSGTIAIEAALRARRIAPGLGRRFAFERLRNFDRPLWDAIRRESVQKQRSVAHAPIFASDQDAGAVASAQRNVRQAGVEADIVLSRQDLFSLIPRGEGGLVVMNPPYGVRLGSAAGLDTFYRRLGQWMKERCPGWTVYLLTADLTAPKWIGLKPARRIPLFNGGLECRLYAFPIVLGGMRHRKSSPDAGAGAEDGLPVT
jgi:putative N6-adenine-specific DNA methylase